MNRIVSADVLGFPMTTSPCHRSVRFVSGLNHVFTVRFGLGVSLTRIICCHLWGLARMFYRPDNYENLLSVHVLCPSFWYQ